MDLDLGNQTDIQKTPIRQEQVLTATSSPLTDVHELVQDERSYASLDAVESLEIASEHSEGSEDQYSSQEDDSKQTTDKDTKPNDTNNKLQQSRASNSTEDSVEHPRKGRKQEVLSEEEPGTNSLAKSRRDSITSGQTTPLENEEGIYLPDRKRPVPFSSINVQDRCGRTLIFKYSSRGDVESAESLLKAGASLRIADHAGWTPLHEACLEGHVEIVRLFLAYDADVDAPGGDGDTPLHDAVGNIHYEVAQLLLRYGASIGITNENGQTALEFALEKYKEAKNELEQAGVEAPQKEEELTNQVRESKTIVELLSKWKEMTEKIVQRDASGQTLLHEACSQGDDSRVLELLDFGSDISAQDNSGWTPLHNASLNGHHKVVDILLRYGADVDPFGLENETPLHDAASNGHIECVNLLLQYGAEPFRKNKHGKMAKDLIPEKNSTELRKLFDYPLDHWQPIKNAEFYPRLLTPYDPVVVNERKMKQKKDRSELAKKAQSSVKKHSQKTATHQSMNKKSFAWGGLDDRQGPFESSREEKKFKALWETIAKQDIGEIGKNSSRLVAVPNEQSPVLQNRIRNNSSDVPRTSKVIENSVNKKRSSVPSEESSAKKPKIMKESSEKEKIEVGKRDQKPESAKRKGNHVIDTDVITKNKIEPKIEKSVEKPSIRTGVSSSINNPVLTPSLTPTIKKEVSSKTPNSTGKDEDAKSMKKKKRFAISGYQRAGEGSNDLSSESIALEDLQAPILDNINEHAPEVDIPEPKKETESKINNQHLPVMPVEPNEPQKPTQISLQTISEPPLKTQILENVQMTPTPIKLGEIQGSLVSKLITPAPKSPAKFEKLFSIKELDSELKRSLRNKYCLPLCAYFKSGEAKIVSLPAADISRWGLIQSNQSRLFLDIQLALCLGLQSGRHLIDKYPQLNSRVATMAEKVALQNTVVSARLLKSMLRFMDPNWIKTVSVNGEDSLKICDIDIHLVSWTPELYQILKSHRVIIESKEKALVDWIHDIKWPVEDQPEPEPNLDEVYVHKKLKRFR